MGSVVPAGYYAYFIIEIGSCLNTIYTKWLLIGGLSVFLLISLLVLHLILWNEVAKLKQEEKKKKQSEDTNIFIEA